MPASRNDSIGADFQNSKLLQKRREVTLKERAKNETFNDRYWVDMDTYFDYLMKTIIHKKEE